jgi:hypothetical protein
MESPKFDELTKALATSTSRRQALKTIAATTLAGLLGLSGIGTAFGAPKCHRNGLGCDTNSNCCSHYCANGTCTCPPTPACNSYCPCPSGQTCTNGQCVSPLNYFVCNCNDGSQPSVCNTSVCADDQITVCDSLCANHGGYGGYVGSCCNNCC